MNERTITFTPKAHLMKGFYLIGKGNLILLKTILKVLDSFVRNYPYHILIVVMIISSIFSTLCILNARSERDAALQKQYKLQKTVEQLQMVLSVKYDE